MSGTPLYKQSPPSEVDTSDNKTAKPPSSDAEISPSEVDTSDNKTAKPPSSDAEIPPSEVDTSGTKTAKPPSSEINQRLQAENESLKLQLKAAEEKLKKATKTDENYGNFFSQRQLPNSPHSHTSSVATLGRGTFGKVYWTKSGKDKQQVAMKEILVQAETKDGFNKLLERRLKEVETHYELPSHSNVVQFKDAYFWEDQPGSSNYRDTGATATLAAEESNQKPNCCTHFMLHFRCPLGRSAQQSQFAFDFDQSPKAAGGKSPNSPISPLSSSSHPLYRGKIWISMEYCNAGTLEEFICRRVGDAYLKEALSLFSNAVSGVSALHQNNILHCDIKPANILLNRGKGELVAKIADLGLCCSLDRDWAAGGTDAYMSPEQMQGDLHGAKSDVSDGFRRNAAVCFKPPTPVLMLFSCVGSCQIYSLGIVLGELVDEDLSITRESARLENWTEFQRSTQVPHTWTERFGEFPGREILFDLINDMTDSNSRNRPSLELVQTLLVGIQKSVAEYSV